MLTGSQACSYMTPSLKKMSVLFKRPSRRACQVLDWFVLGVELAVFSSLRNAKNYNVG